MVARVRTVAFQGIDVLAVDAEVQIAQGLPAFNNVGPIATSDLHASVFEASGCGQ